MSRQVYLDHAAATAIHPKVWVKMRPFFEEEFGNPGAIYELGVRANKAIENSRKQIAQILNAQADEIIFTSGGTEANNLALIGCAWARKHAGDHIITTPIEHASVLEPCRELERNGLKITYLPVDRFGLVNPKQIQEAITPKTILISVMSANNEVGTIEPIQDIGKLILQINKARTLENLPVIYFHSDAVQAASFLDLNVNKLHTDLLTINASKIYGPKGVGVLYKKRSASIKPLIWGGGQEEGRRGGTENPGLIAGLSASLALAQNTRHKETQRLKKIRDYFWQNLSKKIEGATLNGHPQMRLPNNLHISIKGIDGEALLIYLDAAGIQCSTGAACSLIEAESSHVLHALGLSDEQIKSSLRFSLGRSTTKKDLDYVLTILPEAIKKIQF